MKILYLTHTVTWKGGGIFFAAYQQGRRLARRGHDVTLLSISPRARLRLSETMVNGVRIVETPDLLIGQARTGWDPWDTLRRMLYVRDRRFDIIHGFESRPAVALPAFYARSRCNAPLVLTWADWFGRGGRSEERSWPIRAFMPPIEEYFESRFYPRADFTIAMGQPLLGMAMARGIPGERLMPMLHGCDLDGTRAIPQAAARSGLGTRLPKDTLLVGYLGYLWTVNAELLFQTIQMVKQSVDRPVKLILIGNHRVNLSKVLPEDLREDVVETGWLSYEDINLYLCACDVLMLPLKKTPVSESIWPSKLNDYLASGRPVVTTDMPILRPLFQSRRFGYITNDTPEAMARAVQELAADPAAAQRYGDNGRMLAEQELDWERIVDSIEALYGKLAGATQQ